MCITPLCIFDFNEGMIRIRSVHSYSSLEEVLDKTGFKPIVPQVVPDTRNPTKKELKILRNIDKDGFLKNIDKEIVF